MSNECPLSFERLYLDYYPRVYRWAYRMLHHHETAEDVVQETFLRAWRYLANFDPAKGAFSSWLYRITVQVICTWRDHHQGQSATVSLDRLPWEVRDCEEADPQTRFEGSSDQLVGALQTLPQHEQLALVWRASGYREVEIGRHVGKTSRTVRYWLTSWRMHLVEAMEGA